MLFLAWFKCPDKTGKKSADVGEQYLDLIQYRGPDGSPTLKSADQFTGVGCVIKSCARTVHSWLSGPHWESRFWWSGASIWDQIGVQLPPQIAKKSG